MPIWCWIEKRVAKRRIESERTLALHIMHQRQQWELAWDETTEIEKKAQPSQEMKLPEQ